MTLNLFGHKGRFLAALGACGLLLGGCANTPRVVTPSGEVIQLKTGQIYVAPETLRLWARQIELINSPIELRCRLGQCTTVVVVTGADPAPGSSPDSPARPDAGSGTKLCADDQREVVDERGRRCVPLPVLLLRVLPATPPQ